MHKSFKTLFFLKKGNGYNSGPMPIYLRITIDGQRSELTIQRSCEPAKWNQATGRAKGTKAEAAQLNAYLETIQGKLFTIQQEAQLKNERLTAPAVKQKLLGVTQEKKYTLLEVYRYHNKQFGDLVGKDYSQSTYVKFTCALRSLQKFIAWKFNQEDIAIADLSHQFITDYEFYLKSVQGVQHNTAMGIIRKLKKIVRQCVANHWLDKDPFQSFKIKIRETHRLILSEAELTLLAEKDFGVSRLDHVRDIFLFSCFTGLSYSDVAKVSPADLVKGIDGDTWIHTTRTKTDTASRIPLLPTAVAIIEKYRSHPKVQASGKLLPTMSNQRMNSYLKEIADCCGIGKELTFHCARHTFATTVTLSNGVPIETVGKMLGHRSLRTTQHYAKILDHKVSDDMKVLKEKYSKSTVNTDKLTHSAAG